MGVVMNVYVCWRDKHVDDVPGGPVLALAEIASGGASSSQLQLILWRTITALLLEDGTRPWEDGHKRRQYGEVNKKASTMTARPIILTPATPTELITTIISHHRYPTTILVASPKQPFLEAIAQEVALVSEQSEEEEHHLLRKTLMQTAVSRHIKFLFTPTVTHLRAHLSVCSRTESRVQAPPLLELQTQKEPLLVVYGFLELHRSTTEWSAQGLGTSAAALVEAAARNGFRPAVVEPRGGGGGFDTMGEFLGERVPMLSGTIMKDSGAWTGRTVEAGRVLKRWFKEEGAREELGG